MRDELRNLIWKSCDEFALYADEAMKLGDLASAGAALTIHRFLARFAPNDRGETLGLAAQKADAPVAQGEGTKKRTRKPKGDAAAAGLPGVPPPESAKETSNEVAVVDVGTAAPGKPANGAVSP